MQELYCLLRLLLEIEPGSFVDFEQLPHTLGELEIKHELKKVFFPFERFAGCYVEHKDFIPQTDPIAILKHLKSIESNKKAIPAFNHSYYFRSK